MGTQRSSPPTPPFPQLCIFSEGQGGAQGGHWSWAGFQSQLCPHTSEGTFYYSIFWIAERGLDQTTVTTSINELFELTERNFTEWKWMLIARFFQFIV